MAKSGRPARRTGRSRRSTRRPWRSRGLRFGSAAASPGWRRRGLGLGLQPARLAGSCASIPAAAGCWRGSPSAAVRARSPSAAAGSGWPTRPEPASPRSTRATGKVYRRGIVPHAAPLRLAVGAGGLWVSSASTGAVRRIDLGDAAAGAPILAGRGPAGVTVGQRPRLGRQQPLRHGNPRRSLPAHDPRRPDPGRRLAQEESTPAPKPSGSPTRPTTRSAASRSQPANRPATRSTSVPTPAQ